MTWGKAFLYWTRSPEAALKMMIDLNHRFALDGSDPNSYGGILWCLRLFDRPFQPAQPVIGTLRPRSIQSHAARLELAAYPCRMSKEAVLPSLRIAVIGAGVSGLIAARTLSDHGHEVQIIEKARIPGGRISSRRTDSYAFDHGARYFTLGTNDSGLSSTAATGWHRKPVERTNRIVRNGEIRTEKNMHQRYVGVPDMISVARHLSDSLDIRWRTRVRRVTREDQAVLLTDENGKFLGSFNATRSSLRHRSNAPIYSKTSPQWSIRCVQFECPHAGR